MSMRLHEIHPATVHAPITLLPLSLAADALGRLTRSDDLLELGRRTMPLAAAGAVVAGLAGLVAQEAASVPGGGSLASGIWPLALVVSRR